MVDAADNPLLGNPFFDQIGETKTNHKQKRARGEKWSAESEEAVGVRQWCMHAGSGAYWPFVEGGWEKGYGERVKRYPACDCHGYRSYL